MNAFIVTEDHYSMRSLLQRTNIECLRVPLNSYLASNDFCCPLKFFENSFDPDQDRSSFGPDLEPNCLTLIVFQKKKIFFLMKLILKKK